MQVEVVETPAAAVEADVLVITVDDPVELTGVAAELDDRIGGRLAHLVSDGELKGKSGTVTLVHTLGDLGAHRLAAVGLGRAADRDADTLRTAAGAVARRAGGLGGKTVAWVLDQDDRLSAADQARAIVDGLALGPYDAGLWKTNDERRAQVEKVVLCGAGAAGVADDARRAAVVAAWTNRCRDLVNAPPNELTPAALAERAVELVGDFSTITCEVMGPEEIRAAGLGAMAAVAQGSVNPPRLVTLVYEPASPSSGDLVLGLVGKAITFDAGGLSLKPASRMDEMKMDMGGGGAVLCALGAIAELELPVRIVAVIASAENMPGGEAYRPGDILKAAAGKTIEVANTDAEGRLVLADALWHARERGATHIVDLATLTGGIVVAVGDYYAGLFANDEAWAEQLQGAGAVSGDHLWRMPLHPTYKRYLRSPFADLKNSSDVRQATAVVGAEFLHEFAGEGPWAHLDIAGTAFLERSRGDYYDGKGATGFGVRLLAELARRLS
jgi:leucyl aminopeptidase